MKNTDSPIFAQCPLFVCKACHTKTSHAHQRWCTGRKADIAVCEDCAYRSLIRGMCVHPYKKMIARKNEENKCSFREGRGSR